MKKLLLLGGSHYIIPVIQAAHDMGIYVITCDYLPGNVAHAYADEYHNVSIVEPEHVLELARNLSIDGIMSFATDPGVVVASYVAEQLNIPGCPYESTVILQNKDLFRSFLRDNNFHTPMAKSYHDVLHALEEIQKFSFPVIVKPVDSAGSKGVSRIDQIEDLADAFERAMANSKSGKVIIEEFIEQRGHSSDTECFSVNDELVFASFNCQCFDKEAMNPYVPSAFYWPSDMPSEIQRELRSEIQRLIRILHLGTSIYNVETRWGVDGHPYIMEISPRGGGNRLAEILKMACGTDLISNSIRAALGMTVDKMEDPVYQGVWAEYIVHGHQNGVFQDLVIEDSIARRYLVERDLWVKPGDSVHEFTGANQTLGTLVFQFDSVEQAQKALTNTREWIKIFIKT